MEGDKAHEQRQGFHVDVQEKKVSRRKGHSSATENSQKKNPCTRALKMPGYSQVKSCPFGISLYSISMAVVHSRRLISRELEFLLGAIGLTLHWKQINLSSWGPSLQFSCRECWCCPLCCRDGASRRLQRQNFSETQIKVLVLFRFSRKVRESLYFFSQLVHHLFQMELFDLSLLCVSFSFPNNRRKLSCYVCLGPNQTFPSWKNHSMYYRQVFFQP